MKLVKCKSNPILEKNKANDWERLCVLNPVVIYDDDKKFKMLYRAAGDDVTHYIYLGLAESEDGVHFTRVSDQPVVAPTPDNFDAGCIEAAAARPSKRTRDGFLSITGWQTVTAYTVWARCCSI